jgi:hypothetical protein
MDLGKEALDWCNFFLKKAAASQRQRCLMFVSAHYIIMRSVTSHTGGSLFQKCAI